MNMSFQAFVDNHVKLLAEADAAKLVESDYHEDAVMVLMVTPEGQVASGRPALTTQFDYYLKNIYRGFISVEKLAFTDDSICLEATINTVDGEQKVWDVLSMKNGKIFRHFSGLK
jgi:hypothetical protein